MRAEGILGEDSEKAFELRDTRIQGFQIGLPHPEDLAVFQGVDIKDTGCLIDHAVHVTDPPARGSKLYNVFKAIAVDGIAAEQTAGHEGGPFCDVAFLVEELLFFERAMMEEPGKMSRLIAGERDVTGDVFEEKGVVHGGANLAKIDQRRGVWAALDRKSVV